MRRKIKRHAYLIPALALLLLFSQGFMGASYAAWQDQLGIFGQMDTGSFALSFSREGCHAYLLERNRPERAQPLALDCSLAADRKSIRIELDTADLTALLLEEDRLLAVVYPLEADAGSSVRRAALRELDLRAAPDESVQLEAAAPLLLVGGEVYPLPAWADALKQNLYVDVYHALEVEQGQMRGVLCLALDAESRAYLREEKQLIRDISDIPPELLGLLNPVGEGSASLTGELQISYSATLPLFVQQGAGRSGEWE